MVIYVSANKNVKTKEKRVFVKPEYLSRSERVEAVLAKARFSIREAARELRTFNISSANHDQKNNYVPYGPIYRNANVFYRYRLITFSDHLIVDHVRNKIMFILFLVAGATRKWKGFSRFTFTKKEKRQSSTMVHAEAYIQQKEDSSTKWKREIILEPKIQKKPVYISCHSVWW